MVIFVIFALAIMLGRIKHQDFHGGLGTVTCKMV